MDRRGEADPAAGGRAVTWWVTAVCVLVGLVGGFAAATRWWEEPADRASATAGWRRVAAPGGHWSLEVPGAPDPGRTLVLVTPAGGRRLRLAATTGPPAVEVGAVDLVAPPGDRPTELHAVVDAYLAATRTVAGHYDASTSRFAVNGAFSGRRGGIGVGGVVVADEAGRALTVLVVGDGPDAAAALLRVVDSIRAR